MTMIKSVVVSMIASWPNQTKQLNRPTFGARNNPRQCKGFLAAARLRDGREG